MRCTVCGGDAEDIRVEGKDEGPVLVHREVGACWVGKFHAFAAPHRPSPAVLAVNHGFQRFIDGTWKWPWE